MTSPSPSSNISNLKIPYLIRNRHIYIAGSSQHGKSTFMERLIAQDLNAFHNGHYAGVTVLDPKSGGPLAEAALARIPEARKNDAIYFDVSNPIPLDLMSWETKQEYQTLQGELFNLFTSFSPVSPTDQWPNLLRATIATLLASKVCAFSDINDFLANPHKKKTVLDHVIRENHNGRFDMLLNYWKYEANKLRPDTPMAVLGRMKPFIFSALYPVLTGLPNSDSTLKIADIIKKRKIFIVNLGKLDKEAGQLAGKLIVLKLQQAIFRQTPKTAIPHFFHADEFQNFQTSAFDVLLSEVGGFRFCMTLANQGFYQLDDQIKRAVFTNVTAARIAFRLDHEDVSNWKHLLPTKENPEYDEGGEPYFINPNRLSNLPPHKALYCVSGYSTRIKTTKPPLDPPTASQIDRAKWIEENTLATYAQRPNIRESPPPPSQEPEKMVRLENGNTEGEDRTLPTDRATGTSPRTSRKTRAPHDQ